MTAYKKGPMTGALAKQMVLSVGYPRLRFAKSRALRCSAPRAPCRATLMRCLDAAPLGFESHRSVTAYKKGPMVGALAKQMVLSVGFEPATFRSGGERSIQLS